MTTNRNEIERYELTQEQRDDISRRADERLIAEAAERKRVEEWPDLVDQVLNRLMERSLEDREALAALGARLAELEAHPR